MEPPPAEATPGRAAFDEAPWPAAVVDGERRLLALNPAFGRRIGSSPGEPCHRLVKGRDRPCEPCVAAVAAATGAPAESDEEGVSRAGEELSWRARAVPLAGEQGRVLLLYAETTELSRLRRELDEVERLAAVGLSAAGVAHTVKNLLAGMEGGVYLVDSSLERDDRERLVAGWEMVRGYVDQVGALVGNLLRLARTEEPVLAEVAPGELVEEAVRLHLDKARQSGAALVEQVDEGLPPVRVDRDALAASLANLVTNALDACAWDLDLDKQHRVAVVARAGAGETVVFEVSDNGPGIPEEHQDKVLSAAFTTKGMRGTGLGLLLTRRAAERHGGRIAFDSTPGRGTTFSLELPATRDLPLGGTSAIDTPGDDA